MPSIVFLFLISMKLGTISASSIGRLSAEPELPIPTCYDNYGFGYGGTIPDPNDCFKFYTCVHLSAVSVGCPNTTAFDFETCGCIFQYEVNCYKSTNCTHIRNFFKCACKYEDCLLQEDQNLKEL